MEIEKFEVAKLELKKGDILVVRVPEDHDGMDLLYLQNRFREFLRESGHENDVLIFTKAAEISILTKSESQDPWKA